MEPTRTIGYELSRPANLLSLARVPMAMAVVLLRDSTVAVIALMVAAGLSDVLDGWVARHGGGDPKVGAWLDPVCDKAFVAGLVAAVAMAHPVPWWILALPMVREVFVIVPTLLHLAAPRRTERSIEYTARPSGKATTVAQFAVLLAVALDRTELAAWLAVLAGALGVWAGIEYLLRARSALAAP